ncbi:MAG: glycoside hydrolase family 3 protein [Acidobacteria bacterium]|nr:MAG: glycoside hydrolase family 3 protein [Acidobacteriota bacterium]
MKITLEQAVGQLFLTCFVGRETPPEEIRSAISRGQIGGIVLFRHKNVGSLDQLRALTEELQVTARAAGQPSLIIAADQEGGQLMAIGEGTPFPGNLALGATGSEDLARRTGVALGREVAALGINVDFAPVCDVNINPNNPVVGTRSFGEDPHLVARLAAAMIQGFHQAGVAATAKHFPGHGDTATDSHHGVPVLPCREDRLAQVELPPFVSAIEAGVRLIMTAHIAVPALNHGALQPSTLSRPILRDLLRTRLGFRGVVVTDAMDMGALEQGPALAIEGLAALHAGVDLLLFNVSEPERELGYLAALQAARRGLLQSSEVFESAGKILALKEWLEEGEQPGLDVIRCPDHQALAREIAEKSVTLVRDEARRLPLDLPPSARIAVVLPRPQDLTPADTSSYLVPSLAVPLRCFCPAVDEILVSMELPETELRAVVEQVRRYDVVIVGTINATDYPGQARLVEALIENRVPVIAVALRMPYDLRKYPAAPTYLCTYSILPPSLEALAKVLCGKIAPTGKLPVSIPEV